MCSFPVRPQSLMLFDTDSMVLDSDVPPFTDRPPSLADRPPSMGVIAEDPASDHEGTVHGEAGSDSASIASGLGDVDTGLSGLANALEDLTNDLPTMSPCAPRPVFDFGLLSVDVDVDDMDDVDAVTSVGGGLQQFLDDLDLDETDTDNWAESPGLLILYALTPYLSSPQMLAMQLSRQ